MTLNRGYRGTTGTGISVYKGTVNEIPVGYVAFDVQKVKYNATRNNGSWAQSKAFAAGSSVLVNGQTYYTVAGGTTASTGTGPTHTSGSATDGNIIW